MPDAMSGLLPRIIGIRPVRWAYLSYYYVVMTPKDPEQMSDEELKAALSGVTEDQIRQDAPLGSEPATTPSTEEANATSSEAKTDPSQATEPTTESKKPSGVAKLLSERNERKKKYEELKAEKDSAKQDEEMDEFARDEKVIDANSRMAYASERMSDIESQVENQFYQENPVAEQHKDGIKSIQSEYPQLSIDKAWYLYASQNNPLLLLDEQQLNKMK